jgi:hypothetical protein
MLYRVHPTWVGFELTTLVVICTDCIGSSSRVYEFQIFLVTSVPGAALCPYIGNGCVYGLIWERRSAARFWGTKMCLTLLLLPMQSVHITTKVVSSNPTQVGCTRYNIMWLSVTCGKSVTLSINKTDHHDITIGSSSRVRHILVPPKTRGAAAFPYKAIDTSISYIGA